MGCADDRLRGCNVSVDLSEGFEEIRVIKVDNDVRVFVVDGQVLSGLVSKGYLLSLIHI